MSAADVVEIVNGEHRAQLYTGSGAGLSNLSRTAIAAGTPQRVLVNDANGFLAEIGTVPVSFGGTGTNLTGQTGILKAMNGVVSADATIGTQIQPTSLGGTGIDSSGISGIPHIAAGTWSAGPITNFDIASTAAVARSKLAIGALSHVVINDANGAISSEEKLATSRGGTNLDTSGATGVPKITSGAWFVGSIVDNDLAAGISRAKLAPGPANQIAINDANGLLVSEARLANIRGGTGVNSASSTGLAHVTSGVWTFSPVVDADVGETAAIGRGKLATGTANEVLINSSAGAITSEPRLAVSRGGTGLDLSLVSGGPFLLSAAAGTVSASTQVATAATASTVVMRNGNGDVIAATLQGTTCLLTTGSSVMRKFLAATTTTGNASATLVTFTIPPGTNGGWGRCSATIVYAARASGGFQTGSRLISWRVSNLNGTMTAGAVTSSITDQDSTYALSTIAVSVTASGPNCSVNVNGVSGMNISWTGNFELTSASF